MPFAKPLFLPRLLAALAATFCLIPGGTASGQQAADTRPLEGLRENLPRVRALQGARVVVRPGESIEEATVLLRGSTITAVGKELTVPPGAETIDLSGRTLYAGLIDAWSEVDAPQSSGGASHWNRWVTPERSVAGEAPSGTEKLRRQGITVRLQAPRQGIVRGTSAAVLTGGPAGVPPLLRGGIAQHLQLTVPRGGDRAQYPNSPMGAVALVRQTLIDAHWYRQAWSVHRASGDVEAPEVNEALERLAEEVERGRFVIDCPNERFIERADALAREFSLDVILRGSGREYRQLDAIAATGRPLLLPVAFPEAPEVTTPEAARDVSLTALMHWKLAPENPALLDAAGVRFALTSDGLSDLDQFLAQVRLAVRRGLDRDRALAALTTVPAQLLGIDSLTGSITAGRLANFVVVDGELMDEEGEIVETWVAGHRYKIREETPAAVSPLEGDWRVTLRPAVGPVHQLRLQLTREKQTLAGKISLPEEPTEEEPTDEPTEEETDEAPDEQEKENEQEGDSAEEPAAEEEQEEEEEEEQAEEARSQPLRQGRAEHDRFSANFRADQLDQRLPEGVARLVLTVFRRGGADPEVRGEILWPNQTTSQLELRRVSPSPEQNGAEPEEPDGEAEEADEEADEKSTSEPEEPTEATPRGAPPSIALNYPLGAYGRSALPEQPQTVLFRGATVWTCGPEGVLEEADVLVRRGKIAQVGKDLQRPPGSEVVDARGMHLTPGIIDCHSHIATDGGINESARAVTADVRIGDFIDPTDISIYRQLAGGVTTSNILHGSANPIGGQNQVIKLRWGGDGQQLKLAGAPPGIKFALGENVKQSNWGERFTTRYPQTRMGVEQILRDQFLAAREYDHAWRRWRRGERDSLPPRRDLRLEAIAEILRGERWVHCHSYRQDEVSALLSVLQEFNVQIGTLQHILEGYKVADQIADQQAMASTFSDWWAFKFEVYDAVPYNAALMHDRGIVVSMNSDDRELGRHLNTEAAKATKYGGVPEEEALKMVTLNPARQLRIDATVGSIEAGKDADLVLWSGRPLSTRSRCEQTWIDGRRYFSRAEDAERRQRDAALRVQLVQEILSGDRGSNRGERRSAEEDERWVAEEDRWAREDLFCAARGGHGQAMQREQERGTRSEEVQR